jgi:hypothetical protein
MVIPNKGNVPRPRITRTTYSKVPLQIHTVRGHQLHFSIHRKEAKKQRRQYFLCVFAVNKNSVIDRSKYNVWTANLHWVFTEHN